MKSHHFSSIAFVFVAFALQAADASEPTDRTPASGNPPLEQDEGNRTTEQATPAEKDKKRSNTEVSGVVATAIKRADSLLMDGKYSIAAEAYHELLVDSMEHLTATPQALTDCFNICFGAVRTVEVLDKKGERALARTLCDYTRKGLQRCRETMPEWNPAIVEYRLKKVEECFAKLQ